MKASPGNRARPLGKPCDDVENYGAGGVPHIPAIRPADRSCRACRRTVLLRRIGKEQRFDRLGANGEPARSRPHTSRICISSGRAQQALTIPPAGRAHRLTAAFRPFVRHHRHQHAAFRRGAALDQAFDRDAGIAHRGRDLGQHAGAIRHREAQIGFSAPARRPAAACHFGARLSRPASRRRGHTSPRAMSIRSATTAARGRPFARAAPLEEQAADDNCPPPPRRSSEPATCASGWSRGDEAGMRRAGTGPAVAAAFGLRLRQPDEADTIAQRMRACAMSAAMTVADAGGGDAALKSRRVPNDEAGEDRQVCARRRCRRCRMLGSASA